MADQGKAAYDLATKQQGKLDAIARKKSNGVTQVKKQDYSIFQASPTNPLNVSYTNTPTAFYVSFERGECKDTTYIEVYDNTGALVPFQWEDDVHPNPKIGESFGAYSDGSLKCGKIWVIASLSAKETKTYTIRIYEIARSNTYTPVVVQTVTDATPGAIKEQIIVGSLKLIFHQTIGYMIRYLYVDNVLMNGGAPTQRISIVNNAYASIDSASAANTQNVTRSMSGSGVIFLDYVSTFNFAYDANHLVTSRIRVWANGTFDVKVTFTAVNDIASGVLNGVAFKFAMNKATTVTATSVTDEGFLAIKNSAKDVALQVKYYQYQPDGNTNTYSNIVDTPTSDAGDNYLNLTWSNTNPTTFAISKGSQYSCQCHFVTSGNGLDTSDSTNVTAWRDRMMNRLTATATAKSVANLESRLFGLAQTFFDLNYDKAKSITNFNGLWSLIDLTKNKLSGEDKVKENIDSFYSVMTSRYSGGTSNGIYSAYTGGRGIEYIGRDTSGLRYLVKECQLMGYGEYANRLSLTIHNVADFYVQVESVYGSIGAIPLQSGTVNNDNLNAEASAMAALKLSLDIKADATRQAAYDRIKSRFEGSIKYQTILPYAWNWKTIKDPYAHYHCFSVFDYFHSVDTIPFDYTNYIMDISCPSGAVKEYGYNWNPGRFGFIHTTLYGVYALRKAGTISTLQQACNMLEHVVGKCYPSGFHEFPLNGWTALSASIDSPIEMQVICYLILDELYGG